MNKNCMVLAEDQYYSLDTHETQLNNNVLVVGTSGAGKTRSIVIPNLLMATGSYLVSDPKGNLYDKYGKYLRKQGYIVKKLDFTDPANSVHYNPFEYIHSTQDILKVAHMLIYQRKSGGHHDPFWDEASQLLIQALIAYLRETRSKEEQNLHNLMKLIDMCRIDEDASSNKTELDYLFEHLGRANPDSYALSMYTKFRIAASRTLKSIIISVNARIAAFDTTEVIAMTAYDDIDIASIGQKKTALFVVVSDTDRSMDGIVNIFFTQAMHELCRYADQCADNRLPMPTRFIMDDFATNCTIDEFPRMIASIRSREISATLMIQAESQLSEFYGHDGNTVISNCDTYVYLSGNDLGTARAVSERCDVPMKKILNMPVGTNWIFRRGQAPINGRNVNLEQFMQSIKDEEEIDRI